MFNTIRKLFSRRAANDQERGAGFPVFAARPDSGARAGTAPTQAAVPHPRGLPASASLASAATASALAIPLKSVLRKLPADLAPRVLQKHPGDAEVFLPMQKVLAQIAHGAVRISFGELRQAATPGTFTRESDCDRALVELPLPDILARLNPALLARRPDQRKVQVPPDITGPFGSQCAVKISTAPLKPDTSPQPLEQPVSAPAPIYSVPRAQMPAAPVPPAPRAQAPKPVVRIRNAAPAVAANGIATPVVQRVASAPPPPAAPVYTPIAPDPEPPGPGQPAAIRMPEAFRNGTTGAPITPIAPAALPAPEPIRFNGVAPKVPPLPAAAVETRVLRATLADLCPSWPEPLRAEIAQNKMAASVVALPFGLIEGALKQGKAVFAWKLVRSWIQPAASTPASPHNAVNVELPLKIIAPVFLAELTKARGQKKVSIDETIPNLFSSTRPPDPAAGVSAVHGASPAFPVSGRSSDTNYYPRREADRVEEPAPVLNNNGSPGTAFLNRYATPNEIVGKAAALEGVAGALIGLPDGLMVASRVPPGINAETIAAFLPQIFNRVSQCTRELRLGELNNLNFTVGNVPWKIFRVGAIYFAAFGRAGEPLPTAQLAGMAGELDRKAK